MQINVQLFISFIIPCNVYFAYTNVRTAMYNYVS